MLAVAGALAIFIGLAVGILGGGGSILTTPLLVYVMGFDTKDAIAASLFVVGVTSAFGLIRHARGHRVRWRTGLIFGAAGMVGAFIGGQVGVHLPGAVLMAVFAVMMGVTAIAMIRVRPKVKAKAHKGLPIFRILLDGAVVGFVTGLVGAGGGFLVVPALAILGGMPMPMAVGTSLLVVMMKSTAGFLGYAVKFGDGSLVSWNPEIHINWLVTIVVTIGAVAGALVGSSFVGRVHPDRLRKAFGWSVLVMACFIMSQELGATIIDFADDSTVHAIEVLAGIVLMLALIIFLVRWPVKQSIGDFDDPSAATDLEANNDLG
ncbi:MAG: sulfite exporter TauE/SafE family protein [Candidatus Nanopelagicales bacterium]|nr:sulfite exporter TauE/SafE family protein [Candidatus Nanopelagicales bacterium]